MVGADAGVTILGDCRGKRGLESISYYCARRRRRRQRSYHFPAALGCCAAWNIYYYYQWGRLGSVLGGSVVLAC